MNRESVEQVTAPLEGLSSGGELQASEIDDRTVGRVLAGNPLGIVKREISFGRGDHERRVKDLARRSGGIDSDGDRRSSGAPTNDGEQKKADHSQGSGKFHLIGSHVRDEIRPHSGNYEYSSRK